MTAAPHMAEAMKPCPFCGGPARCDTAVSLGTTWAFCEGCAASTADGSKDYAIAAWNRRAPDEKDAEIARLREALADLAKQSRRTWNLGAQCGSHWTHLGVAVSKAERALTT